MHEFGGSRERSKIYGGLGSPSAADSQARRHSASEKTPDDIFKLAKDENIEDVVDVRFCARPARHHAARFRFTFFDESVFEDGLAFDGSSITRVPVDPLIDMLLLPDPETATIDPFRAAKTLIVNFFVHDPFTLELYWRDPRNVARKAEHDLDETRIAHTA